MDAEGHTAVGALGVLRDEGSHGKYRILAQIGEGGMAAVYLAVARGPGGFNKLVVLKTLKREFADDPAFRKMFLREAQLAARLNHPGIVQTYEVIETAGAPLIVMEYLDGQTLSKVRKRAKGNLSLSSHLRIIADATGALHSAHELTDFDGRPLGLVHRDMTPHNIFVTFDGQVKLLDFGIAKLTTSMPETQIGILKGKLRYMPPEQIAGDPVDRRTDIYAVGVMLWEAAVGEPLWKGCSDVAVMKRVLAGDIPSPRATYSQVAEELDAICMKALSPAQADRYATAADIEADIEAFLDELGSRVNGRSIAKFTSTLFADVRAETKALIEAQLSKVALLPAEAFQTLASEEVESLSLQAYGASFPASEAKAATSSTSPAEPSIAGDLSGARRAARHRRRLFLLGIAALGLLGMLGTAIALRETSTDGTLSLPSRNPAAAPAPSAAPGSMPSQAAAETPISIRITANPGEATLHLDGQSLAANPFVASMIPDGLEHRVMAEAPGYQSRSSAFLAERDTELVIDLERAKPILREEAPQRTAPSAPAPSPPPAPAKTSPARAADCEPPFEIDRSGIKRFKIQCL